MSKATLKITVVGPGWSGIQSTTRGDETERHGTVATPDGYVHVHASAKHEQSTLNFIFENCCYERQYRQSYSERYLATLAKRFAEEVTSGNVR